jgi:hypothetical protein
MSNLKKTIQINPELFRLTGNKTKKNKEKKDIPIPIISPNNLKNKLLSRIKEHKNKELKEKEKDKENQVTGYTDEFNGALDYLSELSKKHKQSSFNQTVKNPYSPKNINPPHVELNLPPELEPNFPNSCNMSLNYKIDNEIPHGCLRGGKKPTYRIWNNQTRKNSNIALNPPVNVTPVNVTPMNVTPVNVTPMNVTPVNVTPVYDNKNLSREDRLKLIKNKLKNIETKNNISPNIEFKPNINKKLDSILTEQKEEPLPIPIPIKNDVICEKDVIINVQPKKFVKTTIRRKYTLGKSNMYRKVGVLIKDKQTRKNVLNAQKELKKTAIGEVKKYLRNHGIIKVGSTAPNDVLRKTYESAKLAGEITNTNKDTLLHNFLNGEENMG